jgi:hypothetical protein
VHEIIQAGGDLVGFSVSGTNPEARDAIRVDSHLPDLHAAIHLFHQEKQHLGLRGPRMHIIFLMVKDNIREVPMVPSLAKEAGIEEVALTNICHTINPRQETQRIFVRGNIASECGGLIKQAEVTARKLNIRLKKPALSAVDVPVCAENPLGNFYISAEGEVSPCVYLHPPLLANASSAERNTGSRRSASATSSEIISLPYGVAAVTKILGADFLKGKRGTRSYTFRFWTVRN